MDALLQALIESVPVPALRTEAVPVPRALGRVCARHELEVAAPGDALTPLQIGLVAAKGTARVEVYPRPTVAVFSFGDALLRAGEPDAQQRWHDAASPMLQALLSEQRIESMAWPSLPQQPERVDAALGDALDSFDLVLITATPAAEPILLERLPRLGVALPAVAAGPRAWRSSRARLIWLEADLRMLEAQFKAWVVPILDALQYRSLP